MKLFLFALLITIGCTPMDKGRTSSDTTPRIAFVTMKATRTDTGTALAFIDKRITPGTFKQGFVQPSQSENAIVVEVYEQGQMTSSLKLDDPLDKEAPYSDSAGAQSMRHVELPEAEFFFRVQLHGLHASLRFFEVRGSEARRELFTLDL